MGNFFKWMVGADSLYGGKKKNKASNYDYQPYSGARPMAPSYTKESEKAYWDIINPRSQGIGVGYAPEWMTQNTDLIRSELAKQQEDQIRSAQGSLSAAGLSGNPRAIEAMTGRINRDVGRQLGDELAKISIADLERKNQERDINTSRLGQFNQFQFGQGNKVADFDLGVYGAEQGNRAQAYGINEATRQYDQTRGDEQFSDLLGTGLNLAQMYYSPQSAFLSQAAQALSSQNQGKGLNYQTLMTSAGPGYRKGIGNRYLTNK